MQEVQTVPLEQKPHPLIAPEHELQTFPLRKYESSMHCVQAEELEHL
jgi:hypothetical protein